MQGLKLGQGHTKMGSATTNTSCRNCGKVYNIKHNVRLGTCGNCGMRMRTAVPPMR
jgi:transcription elongation factor Elf1